MCNLPRSPHPPLLSLSLSLSLSLNHGFCCIWVRHSTCSLRVCVFSGMFLFGPVALLVHPSIIRLRVKRRNLDVSIECKQTAASFYTITRIPLYIVHNCLFKTLEGPLSLYDLYLFFYFLFLPAHFFSSMMHCHNYSHTHIYIYSYI